MEKMSEKKERDRSIERHDTKIPMPIGFEWRCYRKTSSESIEELHEPPESSDIEYGAELVEARLAKGYEYIWVGPQGMCDYETSWGDIIVRDPFNDNQWPMKAERFFREYERCYKKNLWDNPKGQELIEREFYQEVAEKSSTSTDVCE